MLPGQQLGVKYCVTDPSLSSCSHSLALQSLDTFSLHQSPYHPSTCDVWNILLDAFKSNSVKRSCADEAKKSRNLNKNTSEYKQNGWYQQ